MSRDNIQISVISSNAQNLSKAYMEVLPSYDEVTNPNAPPPSYEFYINNYVENRTDGAVQEITEEPPEGIKECMKTLFVIIFTALGCLVVIGVITVVPLAMIVIGIIYFNDCPQQTFIPTFLIIAGFNGLIHQLLKFVTVPKKQEDESKIRIKKNFLKHFNIYMVLWFVVGSICVYLEYEPNYNPTIDEEHYCNEFLYMFTFWIVSLANGCLGIALLSVSILAFISQCKNVEDNEQV